MSERPRKILIVEDSRTILLLLQRLLEGYPQYQVLSAADAPTALQLARENELDLVVLDMLLPIMNGFEVARAIRNMEQHRETPLVALTSFGNEAEWRSKALEAGCQECLDKAQFFNEPASNLSALLTKYLNGRRPASDEQD